MRKLLLQTLLKVPLTEPRPADDDPEFVALSRQLKQGIDSRFGRSLSIRQIDAGSCNGCELEIHALNNPFYDLERFGLKFVASPRHADLLLVTGPVTFNMREALQRTYDATPGPKWVVAAGACAAGRRPLCRKLRLRRRGLRHHSGRFAHSRLPAHAHKPDQGAVGAGREKPRLS